MDDFFSSGGIVDLILAIVAIEVAALAVYFRRTGRGVAPIELVSNLLSGVCLLLALRAALLGASWVWVALPLIASFLAHLADLRRRWQGDPS
jgi:hypothetical protein